LIRARAFPKKNEEISVEQCIARWSTIRREAHAV
jgi:hypothetical protein